MARSRRTPFVWQRTLRDCGPACLTMVLRARGMNIAPAQVAERCSVNENGVSAVDLKAAANSLGADLRVYRAGVADLEDLPMPLILHWAGSHYVVLDVVTSSRFVVVDPTFGRLRVTSEQFHAGYSGVALAVGDIPGLKNEDRHTRSVAFPPRDQLVRAGVFALQAFLRSALVLIVWLVLRSSTTSLPVSGVVLAAVFVVLDLLLTQVRSGLQNRSEGGEWASGAFPGSYRWHFYLGEALTVVVYIAAAAAIDFSVSAAFAGYVLATAGGLILLQRRLTYLSLKLSPEARRLSAGSSPQRPSSTVVASRWVAGLANAARALPVTTAPAVWIAVGAVLSPEVGVPTGLLLLFSGPAIVSLANGWSPQTY